MSVAWHSMTDPFQARPRTAPYSMAHVPPTTHAVPWTHYQVMQQPVCVQRTVPVVVQRQVQQPMMMRRVVQQPFHVQHHMYRQHPVHKHIRCWLPAQWDEDDEGRDGNEDRDYRDSRSGGSKGGRSSSRHAERSVRGEQSRRTERTKESSRSTHRASGGGAAGSRREKERYGGRDEEKDRHGGARRSEHGRSEHGRSEHSRSEHGRSEHGRGERREQSGRSADRTRRPADKHYDDDDDDDAPSAESRAYRRSLLPTGDAISDDWKQRTRQFSSSGKRSGKGARSSERDRGTVDDINLTRMSSDDLAELIGRAAKSLILRDDERGRR